MNNKTYEKETIITDLGRKECINYMNHVAKKVIKPIMFMDEEQDTIVSFRVCNRMSGIGQECIMPENRQMLTKKL